MGRAVNVLVCEVVEFVYGNSACIITQLVKHLLEEWCI